MPEEPRPPFFSLPGFYPDAIPYALRTAAALILAYGVGFYAQIPSASSAGITVGIIAQPSAGMALSKAFYRVLGTVIGCIVSIIFGAAFGQDRTMLLFAFALWMGLCSAAATLLRDFRSYGAAISGYTVAIIAIGGIDDPDGLLLASLNRTAAILLGIASVALINSLFGGVPALDGLISKLRTERARVSEFVIDALEGRTIPDDFTLTQRVANITGLETDANYAAAEQINGRRRRRGARHLEQPGRHPRLDRHVSARGRMGAGPAVGRRRRDPRRLRLSDAAWLGGGLVAPRTAPVGRSGAGR